MRIVLLFVLVPAMGAIAIWRLRRRNKSRGRKSSMSGFAWGLMFLGGGRMPPPPPQSQIEQETGERKNREIGRAGE